MIILWIASGTPGIFEINIGKERTLIHIKFLTISFSMCVQVGITPRFTIISQFPSFQVGHMVYIYEVVQFGGLDFLLGGLTGLGDFGS